MFYNYILALRRNLSSSLAMAVYRKYLFRVDAKHIAILALNEIFRAFFLWSC